MEILEKLNHPPSIAAFAVWIESLMLSTCSTAFLLWLHIRTNLFDV